MENPTPTTEAVAKATAKAAPTHPKSAPALHSLNVANSTSSALLEYHAAMVKPLSFFFLFSIFFLPPFSSHHNKPPPPSSSSSILICNKKKIIAPSAVTSIKQFKQMCAESGLSANCCALPVVSFHFLAKKEKKKKKGRRREKGKGKENANDDWDIRLVRIFFVISCKMWRRRRNRRRRRRIECMGRCRCRDRDRYIYRDGKGRTESRKGSFAFASFFGCGGNLVEYLSHSFWKSLLF